jgi:hypothetical protein
MKHQKTWAIIGLVATGVLAAPAQALAWHVNLPGAICQANLPVGGFAGDGEWIYQGGALSAANSNGNSVYGVCPIIQGGATVNNGGGSWWFQDNQTVTLSVGVEVATGDAVTAWACLISGTSGSCGNGAVAVKTGLVALKPDLSVWATDNGSIPAYVLVDLGVASSVVQVFTASY